MFVFSTLVFVCTASGLAFYSHSGNVLFPHWVIVSLARLHQAKRLQETIIPTVGIFLDTEGWVSFNNDWLLKIKRHLSKTSPSLPSSHQEAPIYGLLEIFISPVIPPFISPYLHPLLVLRPYSSSHSQHFSAALPLRLVCLLRFVRSTLVRRLYSVGLKGEIRGRSKTSLPMLNPPIFGASRGLTGEMRDFL